MVSIQYRAENFPGHLGPRLKGTQILSCSWADLLWAALTVGRGELAHVTRHGVFSAFEMAYRVAILYANLRESSDSGEPRLIKSSAYEGLDPSEKSAISYFIGMTMTKLFAENLLDTPWLMHVDVYRHLLNLPSDAQRPDLIGKTAGGEWVALESKGRTNGFDQAALTKAKAQTQKAATVGGESVSLRVAALTYFDHGELRVYLDDPDETRIREEKVDLRLTDAQFYDGYYRPFRRWFDDSPRARKETIDGVEFVMQAVSEFDLEIGVRADWVQSDIVEIPRRSLVPVREAAEGIALGRDGVVVRTGVLWSRAQMQLEPQERRR